MRQGRIVPLPGQSHLIPEENLEDITSSCTEDEVRIVGCAAPEPPAPLPIS
jgi:hypothetical protein